MPQQMMYRGYEIYFDDRRLTVIGFSSIFATLQDAKDFIDKMMK
mgnify:CR=1 FL=1